jgi:hypothetical protein
MTTRGRFDSRAELESFVWARWLHTPSNQHQIAIAARVSDATVNKILSKGKEMVSEEFLVPGATIKHVPSDENYTVISNSLKLRDPTTQFWHPGVRYCNDKGEEFVRAVGDFASFVLVAAARTLVDKPTEQQMSNASPEFQLEQPHPTADERIACDELTVAARNGALALVVCPAASAWIPTSERWPEHGQSVIKRWGKVELATVMRIEEYNALSKETFTAWAPVPPNGMHRAAVLAVVMRNHDEVMYQPLARLLVGAESLGQPVLDQTYITGDNRSANRG